MRVLYLQVNAGSGLSDSSSFFSSSQIVNVFYTFLFSIWIYILDMASKLA